MRIIYTTRTVDSFMRDFTGRAGMAGYDQSKAIKIADENRDFVWPEEKQKSLIKTILAGRPVPAFTIVDNEVMDGGNRATTLFRYCNGEFSVEVGGVDYGYETLASNRTLFGNWNSCQLSLIVVDGATPDERAQIFEDFNSPVTLTCGNLLWNRNHTPLVRAALQLNGQMPGEFPLAGLIPRVWKCRGIKHTKSRSELSEAFQVIVAACFGPAHFHTKFNQHRGLIMRTTEDEIRYDNLREIMELMVEAGSDRTDWRRRRLVFKKFVGAIIHDQKHNPEWKEKWRTFLSDAYHVLDKDGLNKLHEVGTGRANVDSRVSGVSANVQNYLNSRGAGGAPAPEEAFSDEEDEDDEEDDESEM